MPMPIATPTGVVSEKKSAIITTDLRRNLACHDQKASSTNVHYFMFIINL
jgi:hypothetical protein